MDLTHLRDGLNQLRAELRGALLTRGDFGYEEARALWNGMIDRRPAAIVRCAGVADVLRALEFARRADLPVSVRGGGHNVAGSALRNGAVTIDLSAMKGIRIDAQARRATVQGGATVADLDDETVAVGLVTTAGTVSTTGIAGLTLGGGLGWLMGKHGLACDNLVAADVVTADGRFINANATEHAELLWALRGGGGNFGVVTAFDYRLHELEPITGGLAVYPFRKVADMLRFYRDFTREAPDSVVTLAGILNGPADTSLAGQKVGFIGVCHSGSLDDGDRLLRPIKAFGPPAIDTIGPMPYKALQTILDASYPPGQRSYWRSHFMRSITDDVIDAIVALAQDLPSTAGTAVFFEHLAGAAGRANPGAAFAHRDTPYNLTALSVWRDRADDDKYAGWTRAFGDATRAHSAGTVYVNYMGDDEGRDRVRAAYGASYERLLAVKRKYDPTNLFSGNQNIVP